VINAIFQVLPATYLPGEEFPFTKNSENKDFKKVCIKMENVKTAGLKIDFFPIK
jgi:hypothetical protein